MTTAGIDKRVLQIDETLPKIGQAIHAALLTMRAMKATSWSNLDHDLAERVIARTDWQRAAFERLDELGILPHLRVTPLVTCGVCDTCGQWFFAGNKAVGKRCLITFGCPGTVRKVPSTAARR